MKTLYFKIFCKTTAILLFVLFYQQVLAATPTAGLLKTSVGPGDTTQFQKPGKLKKHKKIKNEEHDQEDGVSDDIRARAHQEFLQQRDPKLNKVPLERMLIARQKRDLFLNNIKVRVKNAKPQSNVVKPSGNSPAAPPTAPPTISGLQWHERGPNNVGGRTRALMFDKADSANGYKRVIAGGVGGGLWITSDITATPVQWTKVNDFFDNIAISCIAQNPNNPKEIYAGTGEGFLNADAIQGLGVWKTSDGGATWAQLPSTTGFKYINAILVDRNGSVYVAGETDIFVGFGVDKSSDGGSTWTNVITSSEAGADLQMAANGDVYASTGVYFVTGHIYISDYGVNGANTGNAGTWTNITPASNGVITPSTTSWDRIKLITAPNNANIVYAFFQTTNASGLGSFQQYNRGTNTWTVKAKPTEAFSNGQAWYSIAGAVDPNNSSVIYAGSLDAERSTDGGSTWTQYTQWNAATTASNYVHADHHAYVYVPGSSSRLLMGCDGGVFYTVNANGTPPSFVNKNNGYDVTQFYSVALHPTNLNYALAGAQDNGSEKFSSAGVGPTTVATGGDGADVFIDQTNGNIQVTSYVYDQYYVSTDNGTTFNGLSSFGNGQFINPTAYDPATKSLYAGSAGGYYFRAENIVNPAPAYNEVAVSGFNGYLVTAVTVAPITANRVYFGLGNGSIVLVDNAQTGTSLTGVVLGPTGLGNVTVSCIAVDPTTEDHILVTYSNYGVAHVAETKNASAANPTWVDASGNLPDMPVRWCLFYPGDPTKAIIATELGVWTTDLINGTSTTWDPSNTGLANVEVDMLAYRASDKTLAAATHGRGMFTCSLNSTDATLSALAVSKGTLSPAFSGGTTSYNDAVLNTVTSITVTPTANDPTATIKVNGTAVASGTASGPISLVVGNNTVTTVVTAGDGVTTQTYTVTVNRKGSPNDLLASINPSVMPLSPAFASGTTSYTLSVANSVSSMTVRPSTIDANATMTVNGSPLTSGTTSPPLALAEGTTTPITIVVTAQDGTDIKTYTITVTRAPSVVATLASMSISAGTLSPAFASGTIAYTTSVANTVTTFRVTPTTTDANATIKVNGVSVASGSQSQAVNLTLGTNIIHVAVTAQNGTSQKVYNITVNRVASSNASLASMNPSVAPLSPAFAPGTTSYTLSVSNAVSTMTVRPVTSDAGATMTVNGAALVSGNTSAPIALAEGTTTPISVQVTAQNGTTLKTYTITVTRAPSIDASLAGMSLSSGTLSPVFASPTISYSASVSNSTSTIKVTPTTTDANATIKVNGTTVASGSASQNITLAVGTNSIFVVVTAQNGTTKKTYTITVTRVASANANLASINPSATPLSPAFTPATTSYTLSVPNATASMTVKPTTSDANATLKVNGTSVASGTVSPPIALAVGPNTVSLVVTAQNGTTTKTYTITVTRAAGPVNSLDGEISVTKPTETPSLEDDVILVHQGVSPNGDGVNDFLVIDGIQAYPDNKVTIINRNGQLIYEAKGYDNSSKLFDGHSNKNGQMQLPGTYFYALDYTVKGITKHKTGFIVLKY